MSAEREEITALREELHATIGRERIYADALIEIAALVGLNRDIAHPTRTVELVQDLRAERDRLRGPR